MIKHLFIISLATIISCAPSVIYYDFNDEYFKLKFNGETIAVCPFQGEWDFSKGDSVKYAIPGLDKYPEQIANEMEKQRKCLKVIFPDRVLQIIPNIEFIVAKHRLSFQEIRAIDTAAFEYLFNNLNADYLIFFERAFFIIRNESSYPTTQRLKTTKLVYQIWNLKAKSFLCRGEAEGTGIDVADLLNKYSSKSSVGQTAIELVNSLPECINKLNDRGHS